MSSYERVTALILTSSTGICDNYTTINLKNLLSKSKKEPAEFSQALNVHRRIDDLTDASTMQ